MNLFDALPGKQRVVIESVDTKEPIFVIEVAKNENHSFSASATQFPVEDGINISDHIVNKGVTYNVEGLISDDPISFFQEGTISRFKAPFVKQSLDTKPDKLLQRGFSEDTQSKEIFYKLNLIYYFKKPVNIITDLTKYSNMVMESLEVPRDKETSRALKFKATFREVLVSQIQWTENLAEYEPDKPVTEGTTNDGSSTATAIGEGGEAVSPFRMIAEKVVDVGKSVLGGGN